MNAKTQTTAAALVPGDRFYKLSDTQKQVLEIVDHPVKRTRYTVYSLFCKADADRFPHAILSDTKVVFLRHTTPVIANPDGRRETSLLTSNPLK